MELFFFFLGADIEVKKNPTTTTTNVHGVNRRCNGEEGGGERSSHVVYPVDSACRAFRGAQLVSSLRQEDNLVAPAALDGISLGGFCVHGTVHSSDFTTFFLFQR